MPEAGSQRGDMWTCLGDFPKKSTCELILDKQLQLGQVGMGWESMQIEALKLKHGNCLGLASRPIGLLLWVFGTGQGSGKLAGTTVVISKGTRTFRGSASPGQSCARKRGWGKRKGHW